MKPKYAEEKQRRIIKNRVNIFIVYFEPMARHQREKAQAKWISLLLYRDLWVLVLDYMDPRLFPMLKQHNSLWRCILRKYKDDCPLFCEAITETLETNLVRWGYKRWPTLFEVCIIRRLPGIIGIFASDLQNTLNHLSTLVGQPFSPAILPSLIPGDWGFDNDNYQGTSVSLVWKQHLFCQDLPCDLRLEERLLFFKSLRTTWALTIKLHTLVSADFIYLLDQVQIYSRSEDRWISSKQTVMSKCWIRPDWGMGSCAEHLNDNIWLPPLEDDESTVWEEVD